MIDEAVEQGAPEFSVEEALGIAADLYGPALQATPLPSERDQNFLLETKTGRRVLKIANACETKFRLEFQNRALEHLSGADLPVPGVFRSLSGATVEPVADGRGRRHFVRLVSYLPGELLARTRPRSLPLLARLGELLGRIDAVLEQLGPPPEHELKWDLSRAGWIVEVLECIEDAGRLALVERILRRYREAVAPALARLPRTLVHNDANDYNVLVEDLGLDGQRVAGLIDFGDMIACPAVCEPAVACAYAMMDQADPLGAAGALVAGYHRTRPLGEKEIEILADLTRVRLAVSVANSAWQRRLKPDDDYLQVSDRPAWELLETLETVPPALAHYRLRQACGWEPCPTSPAVVSWLAACPEFGPVLEPPPDGFSPVLDLSAGSLELAGQALFGGPDALEGHVRERLDRAGARTGLGRYAEARLLYPGEAFADSGEQRTVHLGVDLFAEAGREIRAPLAGRIHSLADNDRDHDYGPTIVLEHRTESGQPFFTLYGHLERSSLDGVRPGQSVEKGQRIGALGRREENGGWPPHLHFQIIVDLLAWEGDFPGVAAPGQREVWTSLSPDPNLILRLPQLEPGSGRMSRREIALLRRRHLGPSLTLSYREPLQIVRGFGTRLFDELGRAYLDCVNNVAHVGHCHPRVAEAAARQSAVLNTNTRYLHDALARYAERLCGLFPDPLEVCYLVCSGSEANELALRLARTATGRNGVIVFEGAYHGNTGGLVEVSPYKFDGPGGSGAPAHVHTLPMPDPYRGRHRGPGSGPAYAGEVRRLLADMEENGRPPAAFLYESLLGCGGQVVPPPGFLLEAHKAVRAAGGLCIADEVQVGFGRVGSHWWGFELHGVVPDIVTLGKPIGNGHPMGAVITTRAIAEAFANGMEYFNTFGGNPVSCAAGLAVLDVVEEEELRANAQRVGERLRAGLRELAGGCPLIGDVRGEGLFLGFELVRDPRSLEPAAQEAAYLVERMKEEGVLLSTDGPQHNVVKIKPPLPFSTADAELLLEKLGGVLGESYLAG